MKMILPALLTAGMMVSGLAMAAQPQPNDAPNALAPPMVAGASAASTASTGGITAGKVVAVTILVVATVGVLAGVARNDSHPVTPGTTGTH
ncbi:hypothetical protein [Rhodanobacter ginsengiterrae]|uniref:hypothetical protein n=1 Tax=Rhodanobacter ginsengiterrae TaxID=2008451 RepID=UPI003CF96059